MKKPSKTIKKNLKRDPKVEQKIKTLSSLIKSVGHRTNSLELLRKYSR